MGCDTTFWQLAGEPAFRNIGLIIVAVIGFIFAAWRSYIMHVQSQTGINQAHSAMKQAVTSERGLDAGRFQEASSMLGSDKLTVRQAGVLMLGELIEKNHDDYLDLATQTLWTFIKEQSNKDTTPAIKRDVQTALTVLSKIDLKSSLDHQANSNVFETINLFGVNLQGANLSGYNLTNFDLSNAVLVNANLNSSILTDAKMVSSFLTEADLSEANLTNANLENSDFRSAKLTSTLISNANLDGSDLENANLEHANLQNSSVMHANLDNAKLISADLRNVDLWGSYLNIADLRNANLANANLSAANLSNANVKYANFTNAVLSKTDLDGVDLNDAIGLTHAQLSEAINVDEDYLQNLKTTDNF